MSFISDLFHLIRDVRKTGLNVHHTVDHINSTLKGRSVRSCLTIKSASGFFSTDYDDPSLVLRHADWLTQVVQEMRKMASKMEEPPSE